MWVFQYYPFSFSNGAFFRLTLGLTDSLNRYAKKSRRVKEGERRGIKERKDRKRGGNLAAKNLASLFLFGGGKREVFLWEFGLDVKGVSMQTRLVSIDR